MHHIVIDEIPHDSHLMHIPELDTGRQDIPNQDRSIPPPLAKDPAPTHLGGGLPPVPGKLARKIEEGQFIEMAELLPEHLSTQCEGDDQSKAAKPKCKTITSILE